MTTRIDVVTFQSYGIHNYEPPRQLSNRNHVNCLLHYTHSNHYLPYLRWKMAILRGKCGSISISPTDIWDWYFPKLARLGGCSVYRCDHFAIVAFTWLYYTILTILYLYTSVLFFICVWNRWSLWFLFANNFCPRARFAKRCKFYRGSPKLDLICYNLNRTTPKTTSSSIFETRSTKWT